MLDIGWSEFLVIGVVALIVIGPRDLPVFLRTAGRYAGRVKAMAREFRDGLDDIARESELKDLKNTIGGGKDWSATGWMEDDAPSKPAIEKPPTSDGAAASTDTDEAALDAADFDNAGPADSGAAETSDAPEGDVPPAATEKDRPA